MIRAQRSRPRVSWRWIVALCLCTALAPLFWRPQARPNVALDTPRSLAHDGWSKTVVPASAQPSLGSAYQQALHQLPDEPPPAAGEQQVVMALRLGEPQPLPPAETPAALVTEASGAEPVLTLGQPALQSSEPQPQPAAEPTLAAEPKPAAPEPRLAATEPREFDVSLPENPASPQPASAQPEPIEPLPPPPAQAPLLLTPVPTSAQPSALPELQPAPQPAPPAEPQPVEPPPANNGQPTPAPHPGDKEATPDLSAGAWPYAQTLVDALQALAAKEPLAAGWAQEVQAELEQLAKTAAWDDPAVGQRLDRFFQQADQAKLLSERIPPEHRTELLRCGYAVLRRVSVWQHVYALSTRQQPFAHGPDQALWPRLLDEVEGRVQTQANPQQWRKFLLLDDARRLIASPQTSAEDRQFLANTILYRLHSPQLDAGHLAFLSGEPWVEFARQLRLWGQVAVDPRALLTAIEAYETRNFESETDALAAAYDQLRWSPDPDVVALADAVGSYYRNANVRVAVSSVLVNRMLPKESRMHEAVQDNIQGAHVNGESQTLNRLRLVLLPDRGRWRMGLEAQGEVATATASSKGPATFFQDGYSQYRARKMLLIDRNGMRLYNAEAEADTNSALTEFSTDFDDIPLLGSLARSIAKNQYDAAQPAAKAEVENKISQRAQSTLDQQVAARMEQARRDFQTKLLDPLRKLKVDPTPVEFETTRDRLITRYRLAGRDQVAAHTPRPQAPGDSLLSVQMHETAINNMIYHLNLAGRKVELTELYREVTSLFMREAKAPPEDIPSGVFVTFEDEDAVRVDCEDGRVTLLIRIRELEHNGKSWKNFAVRGHYAPSSDQLEANLVRDGVVELLGVRRAGDQIALRAIFSRVLSRNRKLNLVNEQLAQAPELQDQQVTQFAIQYGWIGVALGPKMVNRQALGLPPKPQEEPAEGESSGILSRRPDRERRLLGR